MSMSTPRLMRDYNRQQILLALLNHGPLARADLAERTALSAVTVTSLTKELEESGFITEVAKTEGQAGRPAGIYDLHPALGTLVGIDVQPHELRILTSDVRGECRALVTLSAPHPEAIDALLTGWLESLLDQPPHGPVRQVTLSIPAPVSDQGVPLEPNSLPTVQFTQMRALLAQAGIEVKLDNDANLHALAEKHHGAGRTQQSFMVLIQRESGIGMGLFLDGALYRGPRGKAGEMALASWPDQAAAVPLELLPRPVRQQALSFLVSAIAVALDVGLLIIKEDGPPDGPSSAQSIQTVAPHLQVTLSPLGDDGPALGALVASRERFTFSLMAGTAAPRALTP
ncbi:ROK family transcriptional regulator (plasmid) [Deinococcus taeanensis]|uniref:ROK family transcriptional regulator n=1 Tax=Deinococcus taeanensis TaxID=2737050 RepID=UPI001CDD375B|nr:ROK family transcriptional regulator [Deinococcus taeanensis]UBV44601.1 ROK family transcriptional regulator [Deinococcus taeanensis]